MTDIKTKLCCQGQKLGFFLLSPRTLQEDVNTQVTQQSWPAATQLSHTPCPKRHMLPQVKQSQIGPGSEGRLHTHTGQTKNPCNATCIDATQRPCKLWFLVLEWRHVSWPLARPLFCQAGKCGAGSRGCTAARVQSVRGQKQHPKSFTHTPLTEGRYEDKHLRGSMTGRGVEALILSLYSPSVN